MISHAHLGTWWGWMGMPFGYSAHRGHHAQLNSCTCQYYQIIECIHDFIMALPPRAAPFFEQFGLINYDKQGIETLAAALFNFEKGTLKKIELTHWYLPFGVVSLGLHDLQLQLNDIGSSINVAHGPQIESHCTHNHATQCNLETN